MERVKVLCPGSFRELSLDHHVVFVSSFGSCVYFDGLFRARDAVTSMVGAKHQTHAIWSLSVSKIIKSCYRIVAFASSWRLRCNGITRDEVAVLIRRIPRWKVVFGSILVSAADIQVNFVDKLPVIVSIGRLLDGGVTRTSYVQNEIRLLKRLASFC